MHHFDVAPALTRTCSNSARMAALKLIEPPPPRTIVTQPGHAAEGNAPKTKKPAETNVSAGLRMWLTMSDTADDSGPEILTRWRLIAHVPVVLGPRRRLGDFLPPLPTLAAGQSVLDVEPDLLDCGPNEDAAGQACGPTVGLWTGARRQLRELIDRAYRYARALVGPPALTHLELGEREGISAARVSQIVSLVRLDRALVAHATDLTLDQPVPSVADLRQIARLPGARQQVERYTALCSTLAGQREGTARLTKQRGLQHLFQQARLWRDALDARQFRSISELARAEGAHASAVGKVLDLLRLSDDVIAALDVEPDQLPPGFTQKDAMRIARMKTADEQRAALAGLWETTVAATPPTFIRDCAVEPEYTARPRIKAPD
jgi:hypothetical protein